MANPITRHIPNTITLTNLLCGCIALIFAFSPFEKIGALYGFELTFILILAGALADFLDGMFARILKAYSPLGADLDSLSDLVTFGVAPALLLYNILDASTAEEWIKWSSLLIPVCGALRLARFNVDASQSTVFRGLPIPSCALFCIGLAAIMVSPTGFNPYAAAGCIIFIALMMVAPLRMFSLKFKGNLFSGTNLIRYLLLAAAITFLSIWHWAGFLAAIGFYILVSFVANFVYMVPSGESSKE